MFPFIFSKFVACLTSPLFGGEVKNFHPYVKPDSVLENIHLSHPNPTWTNLWNTVYMTHDLIFGIFISTDSKIELIRLHYQAFPASLVGIKELDCRSHSKCDGMARISCHSCLSFIRKCNQQVDTMLFILNSISPLFAA